MSDLSSPPSASWQFWIDRGGTFTDIVAKSPEGDLRVHKLLSENPERYRDAAIAGMAEIMGLKSEDGLADAPIYAIKMGTTVGTNALLEREGDRVVLVVTKGLRDQLRIGYQARPKLFDLEIKLPEQLYERIIEADERVTVEGEVLTPLDAAGLKASLQAAFDAGIRACAILFLHGYKHPTHEQQAAAIAREIGFTQLSVSHEVSPLIKFVGRGDTTVVDAYLSPKLRRYVEQVSGKVGATRLMFMQSNGGLTEASRFQGKDCILSGPAGGIVGAVETARAHGFDRVITFDMGGTSTDVAHYAGELERTFETQVAGVRMRAPMMQIHTVAAGGGSICHFDGTRLRVGPDSAGANPGPACYRRGGPLTVTDCNVMLGKVQPGFFPRVFGPDGDQPLDADVVRRKFAELASEIEAATGTRRSPVQVAEGFLKIAIDNMALAIKQVSVQRGYDVTRYVLNSFGGAGGQHACLVADTLGIQRILLHPLAGVLSAYGMGLADLRTVREAAIEKPLDEALADELAGMVRELGEAGAADLHDQGIRAAAVILVPRAHLKYVGTDKALSVPYGTATEMRNSFEDTHRQQFGFIMAGHGLVLEMLEVEAIGASGETIEPVSVVAGSADGSVRSRAPLPPPVAVRAVFTDGRYYDTPIYERRDLYAGATVKGPAILLEDTSTIIVEPGWQAVIQPSEAVLLDRYRPRPHATDGETEADGGARPDPVLLEVFNNLFMSVAEQMGVVLENTAYSVNIKERLDFSCAVFDAAGGLVANAPHMPVHLGSMGESVKAIIARRGAVMRPGDVFMLNDPFNGGTHLPDITVITPVFDEVAQADDKPLFFVAARGHHADIGGLTPGSMPPMSKVIEEEGVLIDNVQLVKDGIFDEALVRDLLTGARYPARNPDQNVADLKAQIAANEKGVAELRRMMELHGREVVLAYMRHVQDNAEALVKRALKGLGDGAHTVKLDNGAQISVAVRVDHASETAEIDFTGTSDQLSDNFNAPSAVCRAAVLYVFRSLVDEDIPLNDGCMKPIRLNIPEGSMLNPRLPAAVVAGNVETSQCITDALFGALGVLASAQGTMNNLTFGNARHQYYETICGGAAAGKIGARAFNGTSGIHTHMTNSRLTDPEVLELRYPVLLEHFGIREGSGGKGQFNGGDGVIRRIRFREPMTVSILSNRRKVPPFGLNGGADGAQGATYILDGNGARQEMKSTDTAEVPAGGAVEVHTPGGGGYGSA